MIERSFCFGDKGVLFWCRLSHSGIVIVTVTVPQWQELAGPAIAVSERKQAVAENNKLTSLTLGIKGINKQRKRPRKETWRVVDSR
jgi:hypothetical protein